MALLYSNENFPLPVVERLRAMNHDIVSVLDSGLAGVAFPDDEVLRLATSSGRAVLTLNRRDFVRLHLKSDVHAGIVVCTVDSDFEGMAERIHEAVMAIPILHGQLIRVNRPQRAT